MNKLFNRLVYVCAVLLMVSPLVSCGGGGGGGTAGTTGTLSLGLTDAPGDYQHVWVTIKEIQVNKAAEEEGDDSGWLTVFTMEETIDLKTLENGAIFDFGLAELEIGHYNQMRLILAADPVTPHPFANYLVIEGAEEEEYVIGKEGEFYKIEELKVPSGFQTGIKIVKGFEIVAQGTTALVLDFDAKKSVVEAGNSGQWLLKPTIKVLETVENSVSGTVVDDDTSDPIEGAGVSAQIYDSEAGDAKKEVVVESTANTTAEGTYKFFLPPDIYNIVVTKNGYLPACKMVEALYYDEEIVDFNLVSEADTITISGTVSGLATVTDTAYLSIRQLGVDCPLAANVTIEVASDQTVNGGYSITVPAGTYDLVASAGEITHVEEDLSVDTEELNFDFTPPSAP